MSRACIVNATKSTWKVSVLRSSLAFTAWKTAACLRLTTSGCKHLPKSLSWTNKSECREEHFLPCKSEQLRSNLYCCEKDQRALMVQYILLTLPCQSKWSVSSHGGGSCIPTGKYHVHNLLVCDVNIKSALTDRPQISQLEASDVPK